MERFYEVNDDLAYTEVNEIEQKNQEENENDDEESFSRVLTK